VAVTVVGADVRRLKDIAARRATASDRSDGIKAVDAMPMSATLRAVYRSCVCLFVCLGLLTIHNNYGTKAKGASDAVIYTKI